MRKNIFKLFSGFTDFFGEWPVCGFILCFMFPSACTLYPRVTIDIKLGESPIAQTILLESSGMRMPKTEDKIRAHLEELTVKAMQGENTQKIDNLKKMGMDCKNNKIDCYYHGYIAYDMSHRPPEDRFLKIEFYYLVIDKKGHIETNFKMFHKYSSVAFD